MPTTLANLHRHEQYDVYIGRAPRHRPRTMLGNPNELGVDGDRLEVIRRFAVDFPLRMRTEPEFATAVEEARGKRLGCFCAPAPCHGHVIIAFHVGGLEAVALIANGEHPIEVVDRLRSRAMPDTQSLGRRPNNGESVP